MERILQPPRVDTNLYNQKISENEILYLQDLFLTPGFHKLKFANLKTAREQLYTILDSLQFYQNAAGLSLQVLGLREDITDLYAEILQTGCLNDPDHYTSENLVNFCLNNFYYDFLWIENPQALETTQWYQQLLELLSDFKLDQLIPICLVEF
jgi:hypothetical protein